MEGKRKQLYPSLYIAINESDFGLQVIVTESWNHCIYMGHQILEGSAWLENA